MNNREFTEEIIRCKETGVISDKLARDMMHLVEKLSKKSNWRGYSYIDEMRSEALLHLTVGLLKFDPEKSSQGFAYATAIAWNAFRRVLLKEKNTQKLRDAVRVQVGEKPSHDYLLDAEMKQWVDDGLVPPPTEGLVEKQRMRGRPAKPKPAVEEPKKGRGRPCKDPDAGPIKPSRARKKPEVE